MVMRCANEMLSARAAGWTAGALRLAWLGVICGLASACAESAPPEDDEVEAPQAPAERSGPANPASASDDTCSPPRHWGVTPDSEETSPTDQLRNQVLIDADGSIQWNGVAIAGEELGQYLEIMSQMTPSPRLELEVDADAPCDAVAEVVSTASRLLDCDRHCGYRERPR